MYLIFDTETTGLPKNWKAPITDTDNWPRCVQIAWQIHDAYGKLIEHQDYLIIPEGYDIPYDSEQIHGISTELARQKGHSPESVLTKFNKALEASKFIVGQNVGFDINIVGCEFYRFGIATSLDSMPVIDTCTEATAALCKIPGGKGGKYKLPTLTELYRYLFGETFKEAHNATADVEATSRCFLELIRRGVFTGKTLDVSSDFYAKFEEENPRPIQLAGIKHLNLKKESDRIKSSQKKDDRPSQEKIAANISLLKQASFAHLHNHSQFSILQATSKIESLIDRASKDNMPAVALTDHGNMMAAFLFVQKVFKHNKKIAETDSETKETKNQKIPLKPILGCEFNICEDHTDKSRKDNGYQVVFLAKNKKGYHNLAKMSSIAYIDGFYYVARIDKEVVKQYKDHLIVLTGGLYGEVPSKLLNVGKKQAEEALLWWKTQFKDDLYIELMRHGQENEDRVNAELLAFSQKHGIKTVATNNTYYVDKSDANAHDVLLCVKEGEKQATPIGRGRGFRYGFPNQEYFFKDTDTMKELFKDIPEAILNIQEVVDKIEEYSLEREVLLPKFDIPKKFLSKDDDKQGENNYLRHLAYEGAQKRYGTITPEIKERIDFELKIIANTGYPGYFLIVQDFCNAAREMGVSVGPGRGSAAGSVVAYCTGITNVDPMAYDLLFERFLNPDRVSMPDIDIDFDDEGRGKVIGYVIEKYGTNQVAQIITYGTMAAKSSIRDTARVLDLPLSDADRLAKLVPDIKLNALFSSDDKDLKAKLRPEDLLKANELKNISEEESLQGQTVNQARILEGSVRNTGTHACGVIITPDDITKFVPVATAKDSDLYVTQFDNSVVESAGLLKMDFLGLKTLTLIKDTVKIVKERHGITLDPDTFPLDDEATYALFQRGETVGIFQYESAGMQKYLKELKPTVFADLIAMNALYRPGPLEYIPSFIRRKHGIESIVYDLDACEEYLKETYGITVYQEQVMLLSQKLAGFTKGEADVLRKAMGKKIFSLLEQLKPRFLDGGETNGHSRETLEKIWKDWEAFAAYAFNKSHSTCYAWVAYQTAYLKAHYPAEYMAAVLSNNMNDIKSVSFFMEECKRSGLKVLGPDVNESDYKFTVNDLGAIRFGMGAVKGVGAAAVETIVQQRKNGKYRSVFDMVKRLDLRTANKKAFENLALSGGFDSFTQTHRAQYFHSEDGKVSFLEKVMKYGSRYRENKNAAQMSLFGEGSEVEISEPVIPACEEWSAMEKLAKEKEVVGIYISGHPLDDFKTELKYFCNGDISVFSKQEQFLNREISFGGVLTDVQHRVSKNGKGWAAFTMEDYTESHEFRIFGEDYLKFKHFLVPGSFLYVKNMIRPGWKEGDIRLQFIHMQLLQDIMNTLAKKLTIQLSIESINEETISSLNGIIKRFKGKQNLNFVVYDMSEKLKLHMPSRNVKVKISKAILEELEQNNWSYKLN